tara:strand:+ start:47 stop:220 length:174 start_codon:yes stop_codon:yes gene_type:complete
MTKRDTVGQFAQDEFLDYLDEQKEINKGNFMIKITDYYTWQERAALDELYENSLKES